MISKLVLTSFLVITSIFDGGIKSSSVAESEIRESQANEPLRVSVCDIAKDPAAYNHKQVEVTGFVSRGFEDSGLFDPACSSRFSIWVEMGGKSGTGVMYCCDVPAEESRSKVLVIEGISLSLNEDAKFQQFQESFHQMPDSIVHATLVGTFFSGRREKMPGGEFWVGFGHMGMSSLFVIQQVNAVDPRDRKDLDYRASGDQPDLKHEGCGNYTILGDDGGNAGIKTQKQAESSGASWQFDDPKRVATEDLARLIKVSPSLIKLAEAKRAQGRVVYYWRPNGKKGVRYMVEVVKPYSLLFYAKDPLKIAWLSNAFRVCD